MQTVDLAKHAQSILGQSNRCNYCRCICDIKMIIAQITVSNYDVIMITLDRNMQTILPFVLINRPGKTPKLIVSFCSDYISSILTFME